MQTFRYIPSQTQLTHKCCVTLELLIITEDSTMEPWNLLNLAELKGHIHFQSDLHEKESHTW